MVCCLSPLSKLGPSFSMHAAKPYFTPPPPPPGTPRAAHSGAGVNGGTGAARTPAFSALHLPV